MQRLCPAPGPLATMFSVILAPACAPEGFPDAEDVPWLGAGSCAPTREVDVGCVLDGDTFDVGRCGGERVRLLGVDAPEVAHEAPSECFGVVAADALSERLAGASVWMSFDARCEDDFGRTLAYAWFTDADGALRMVNEWMLREGFGTVYRGAAAGPLRFQTRLEAAEAAAAAEGRGWWSACADEG